MSTFEERLDLLMSEIGINSVELGLKIGVSPSVISRWGQNNGSLLLSNALSLCNLFQCTLDYLVGRNDKDFKTTFLDCPAFYNQIKAVLHKEKVTQYRICKDTSIKSAHFYRWSKGSEAKVSTLVIMADYLDCSLDYLVGRE